MAFHRLRARTGVPIAEVQDRTVLSQSDSGLDSLQGLSWWKMLNSLLQYNKFDTILISGLGNALNVLPMGQKY